MRAKPETGRVLDYVCTRVGGHACMWPRVFTGVHVSRLHCAGHAACVQGNRTHSCHHSWLSWPRGSTPSRDVVTGLDQRGAHVGTASFAVEDTHKRRPSCRLEPGPRRWQQFLSLLLGPGEADSPSGRGSPVWIEK